MADSVASMGSPGARPDIAFRPGAIWVTALGALPSNDPPLLQKPLLDRVARGEFTAVQECMNRYGGLVWSLAKRYTPTSEDAEDATQEIFLALWKVADRYDASLGSEASFIATIARRRLVDRFRRDRKRLETEQGLGTEVVGATPGGSPEAASDVARAARAMGELPAREREVLTLGIVEGFSHQEISEQTGLALGTVKSTSRRALASIRAALGLGSDGSTNKKGADEAG